MTSRRRAERRGGGGRAGGSGGELAGAFKAAPAAPAPRGAMSTDVLRAEDAAPRELGVAAERLLDAQQLGVLGHPIRARRRPGLDLAASRGRREVGDRDVLGLPRTV